MLWGSLKAEILKGESKRGEAPLKKTSFPLPLIRGRELRG